MAKVPFGIETSTIGLLIWNPTNEDLDMTYAGVSMTLAAGQEQIFEIACAKHLLNAFGPRGLTSLVYGCNEATRKKIGEAAVARNLAFKTKQVVEYNQRNESRQMMKLGYLPPTPHVLKYAKELNIKLLEPYAVRDEERAAIQQTNVENEKLKSEVAELTKLVKQLLEKKEPEPDTTDESKDEKRRGNPNWFKKDK
jgi:hypothetical protein